LLVSIVSPEGLRCAAEHASRAANVQARTASHDSDLPATEHCFVRSPPQPPRTERTDRTVRPGEPSVLNLSCAAHCVAAGDGEENFRDRVHFPSPKGGVRGRT